MGKKLLLGLVLLLGIAGAWLLQGRRDALAPVAPDEALPPPVEHAAAVVPVVAVPGASAKGTGAQLPANYSEGAKPPPHPVAIDPVLDRDSLRRAVEQLDPCALFKEGVLNHARLGDVFNLLQARGDRLGSDGAINFLSMQAFFEAFSQSDPLEAARILDRSGNAVADFFSALLRANLLASFNYLAPDFDKALDTLGRLKTIFPTNGAIPFFAGVIRAKRLEGEGALRSELLEAMGRPTFDDFYTRILRVVWEAGVRDPKLLALAGSLIARAPAPLLGMGSALIQDRIKAGDADWARRALDFGKRWMNEGLQEKSLPAAIYWSPVEYEKGRQIALAATAVLGTDRDPGEPWPPVISIPAALRAVPWAGTAFPPLDAKGACRESDLQQAVRDYDQEHKNYLTDLERR